MMSLPEPMPSLTSHLARLAQRFGLSAKASQQALERASGLQLPFARLPEPEPSIFWNDGPCLQRLLELPRGALSGPVQEDKARAHAALTRLIRKESDFHCEIDLRQIDGLGGYGSDGISYPGIEAFAATPACRLVRIISYKDFLRALGTALPGFDKGTPIELRQASWLGERLYWAGEHHIEAFACAVAYARLRGLEVMLPAEVTDYRLDRAGVQALDAEYHAITMPAQAWSDRDFMALLLDTQVPYARLTLLRNAGNSELLLLEKREPTANAIGEGLKLAGAPDLVRYLRDLPQITRFKRGQPAPSSSAL
ncbi:DUF6685 family protein [Pseudomonas lopnurensis]|uniref:DUF6685 family protein n=1 Tax=Pseudomonas lopnurensis TaxID=1477517 RepID=UPI00187AF423|nr:DUF6685 family protein [Pseudomonas lopnurensis]MBE7373311.1 hypothetical protein [Pseudomonas lopnurensis]